MKIKGFQWCHQSQLSENDGDFWITWIYGIYWTCLEVKRVSSTFWWKLKSFKKSPCWTLTSNLIHKGFVAWFPKQKTSIKQSTPPVCKTIRDLLHVFDHKFNIMLTKRATAKKSRIPAHDSMTKPNEKPIKKTKHREPLVSRIRTFVWVFCVGSMSVGWLSNGPSQVVEKSAIAQPVIDLTITVEFKDTLLEVQQQ